MGQFIVEDVPTAQIKALCRRQERAGAIKCEAISEKDGHSDVLVVYPDKELFSDQKERLGR